VTVVLTGGSGFVGRAVLARLLRAGHVVRLLARNPSSPALRTLANADAVSVFPGDVLSAPTLAPAFEGADAVIHLVGIISESGASNFSRVHVAGTQNVVAAAQRGGLKRFIHMSALGTRPAAVSRYHRTKWEAEEIVRRSGLSFTIFRPSLIFGPSDQFVNLLATLARVSPVIPILASRQAHFQPLAVEVVAEAFVRALDAAAAANRTLDLCGPEALTFEQILDAILEVSGRRRLRWRVPPILARWQATWFEWIFPRLLRRPPPLNRDQLIMLAEDHRGDARTANDLFGLSPVRFREGIARYLGK